MHLYAYSRAVLGRCLLVVALVGITPGLVLAQATGEDFENPPPRDADDTLTDIGSAVMASLRLVTMEHTLRIAFQEKTRAELGGPFWKDYGRSVRFHKQWGDGDGWVVNYIGHPIHGAASGFIWESFDPAAGDDEGFGRDYWAGKWRPLAWMAGYSLQFEIGPLSEASIGNVGMRPETTGWVDHVVTPLGGLGFMVAEDALDRYVIARFERHVENTVLRAILRCLLNPSRMLANVSSNQLPWHRSGRPIRGPIEPLAITTP